MKKFYEVLILIFLIINIKTSDSTSLKDGTVYEIDQNIEGTTEYKTKTVSFSASDSIYYLKYDFA